MTDVRHNGRAEDRPLDSFDTAQTGAVLIYGVNPAKPGMASPLESLGGGGTAGNTRPVEVFDPEQLTPGEAEAALTVPPGATHALVIVTAGAVHIGLRSATGAPTYAVGEGVEISGAQLPALRLQRDGATTAAVRADFWREA